MKTILYCVIGLILLSIGPTLIMGILFTAAIYYVLYLIYKAITDESSNSSGSTGDSYYDEGDGFHSTGAPYL